MKLTGIYKITNLINGKFYIGQSVDIKRRFNEHRNPKRKGCKSLSLAIEKYGVNNFSFDVVELCDESDLIKLEMKYISELKPQYNRCKGGKGPFGHVVSAESKLIISEKAKKQWQQLSEAEKEKRINHNLIGPRKGHTVTAETKEKLRLANLGKRYSETTKKKRTATLELKKASGWKQTNKSHKKAVICNELNKMFDSVKEAAKFLSVHPSNITSNLKGRQKSIKGYTFSYSVETNRDEFNGVEVELSTISKREATQ